MFFWLVRNARAQDVIVTDPRAMILTFLLKKIRKCHVHLDVRTLPVEVNTVIDSIDRCLFWKLPFLIWGRSPDSCSFITEALKKTIEAEFGLRFADYAIWGSGADVERFQIAAQTKSLRHDKYVLCYVGSLSRHRGVDRVVGSLAALSEGLRQKIAFRIVGSGPDFDNLQRLASEAGVEGLVQFVGQVPYERMPYVMKDVDCFISPLPDRKEWNVSSPIKVFEYFSCGKPVVLTPIPAHKDIACGKEFVVWTEGDGIHDFATAIRIAYENRVELAEAAKGAPEFVEENFSSEIQGKKLADYLRRKHVLCE
jgi:glycosyltransferase involved in cell wall biosynthesis